MIKKVINYIKDNEINLLVSILFPLMVSFVVFINHFSWISPKTHEMTINRIQEMFSFLWIIPLPMALLSLLGMLLYKHGEHLKEMVIPTPFTCTVYFRLVTRGINQKIVTKTANNIIKTMESFNEKYKCDIQYIMEVITEKTNPSLHIMLITSKLGNKIQIIEIPIEYETRNRALYKARALHFTLDHSPAKNNDWIFHLDDESQINETTVLGILEFISKEEKRLSKNSSYKPHIGQGTILYYRNIHKNLLYTLADSIRTADDMGRYFLQYLLGVCVFGIHGSFILCRNSIEKNEGFDFQPNHCITEDAYWGLKLMQNKYKFGHIYGYVHEQSPTNATDFIRQRRRWFIGITQVLRADDIAIQFKLILLAVSLLWASSGLVIIYTIINIIHPVAIPKSTGVLASITYAIYLLMYLMGFYVNIKQSSMSFYRKVLYISAQMLFIPVFALLESLGVLYGLLYRKPDYYVIKK